MLRLTIFGKDTFFSLVFFFLAERMAMADLDRTFSAQEAEYLSLPMWILEQLNGPINVNSKLVCFFHEYKGLAKMSAYIADLCQAPLVKSLNPC